MINVQDQSKFTKNQDPKDEQHLMTGQDPGESRISRPSNIQGYAISRSRQGKTKQFQLKTKSV
jgi:hypothetical protein